MDLAERLTNTEEESVEKRLDELREVAGIAPEEYFVYSKQGLVKGIKIEGKEIEGKKEDNRYFALMEISLSPEESDSIEGIIKGQWNPIESAQAKKLLGTTGERTYMEGNFVLDFGGVNEKGKPVVTLAYKADHAFTNHTYLNDLGTMRTKLLEIINQPAPAVQETAQAEEPEKPEEAEKPEPEKSLVDFLRDKKLEVLDEIEKWDGTQKKTDMDIDIKSKDGNYSIRVILNEAKGGVKELGILIGSKPIEYPKRFEDSLERQVSGSNSAWKKVDGKYVLTTKSEELNVELKELNGAPQILVSYTLESITQPYCYEKVEATIDWIVGEVKKPEEIKVPEMPGMETYEFPIKDKEVIVGGNFKGYLTAEEIEGELRVRLRIEYKPEDLTLDAIRSYAEKFGSKGYSAMPMDDRLSVRIGLEPGQTPEESYGKAMNVLSEATQIMTRPEESKTS